MKHYPHYAIQPITREHITLRKERWGMDAENCVSSCLIQPLIKIQVLLSDVSVVCVTAIRRQQSHVFLMEYIWSFRTVTSAANFLSKFPKFTAQTSNLNSCILCYSHLLGFLLYLHVNLLCFWWLQLESKETAVSTKQSQTNTHRHKKQTEK